MNTNIPGRTSKRSSFALSKRRIFSGFDHLKILKKGALHYGQNTSCLLMRTLVFPAFAAQKKPKKRGRLLYNIVSVAALVAFVSSVQNNCEAARLTSLELKITSLRDDLIKLEAKHGRLEAENVQLTKRRDARRRTLKQIREQAARLRDTPIIDADPAQRDTVHTAQDLRALFMPGRPFDTFSGTALSFSPHIFGGHAASSELQQRLEASIAALRSRSLVPPPPHEFKKRDEMYAPFQPDEAIMLAIASRFYPDVGTLPAEFWGTDLPSLPVEELPSVGTLATFEALAPDLPSLSAVELQLANERRAFMRRRNERRAFMRRLSKLPVLQRAIEQSVTPDVVTSVMFPGDRVVTGNTMDMFMWNLFAERARQYGIAQTDPQENRTAFVRQCWQSLCELYKPEKPRLITDLAGWNEVRELGGSRFGAVRLIRPQNAEGNGFEYLAAKFYNPSDASDDYLRWHRQWFENTVCSVYDNDLFPLRGVIFPAQKTGPIILTEVGEYGSLEDALEFARKQLYAPWFGSITSIGQIAHIGMGIHAHQNTGIVHRELKPSDLIIFEGGRILVDGCLTSMLDEMRFTRASQVGGPSYMAPEIYDDERESVRVRTPGTDIFAFALIIFELLTHRKVFPSTLSAAIIMRRALDDKRKNLWSTLKERLGQPEGITGLDLFLFCMFVDILQPCLATDPEQRPTIEELVRQICMQAISVLMSFPLNETTARMIRDIALMLSPVDLILAATSTPPQLVALSDENSQLSQALIHVLSEQPALAPWGVYFGIHMRFHGLRLAPALLDAFNMPADQAPPTFGHEAAFAPNFEAAWDKWMTWLPAQVKAYTDAFQGADISVQQSMLPAQVRAQIDALQGADISVQQSMLLAQVRAQLDALQGAGIRVQQPIIAAKELSKERLAFARNVNKRNEDAEQIRRDLTAIREEIRRDLAAIREGNALRRRG